MIWPRFTRPHDVLDAMPEMVDLEPLEPEPLEEVADPMSTLEETAFSDSTDRWEAVLVDLEQRLSLEGAGEPDWFPPSNLGPLPGALLGRARRLALAQENVVAALDSSLDAAAGELMALKPALRGASPVYLDVMG